MPLPTDDETEQPEEEFLGSTASPPRRLTSCSAASSSAGANRSPERKEQVSEPIRVSQQASALQIYRIAFDLVRTFSRKRGMGGGLGNKKAEPTDYRAAIGPSFS